MRVTITQDGPYQVSGGVPLLRMEIVVNEAGESVGWRETERLEPGDDYMLCRCGHSQDKPYCDFTHVAVGFDGSETGSKEPYMQAAACTDGPGVRLRDVRELCSEARFCDRGGGIWNLVADYDDPDARALVEEAAALCPAGRYVVCDPVTDEGCEPDLEPAIALIEDPHLGVSGPLYVMGGIEILSAEEIPYETRNRVTLCRCGASKNKPFCDGSHIKEEFCDTAF